MELDSCQKTLTTTADGDFVMRTVVAVAVAVAVVGEVYVVDADATNADVSADDLLLAH